MPEQKNLDNSREDFIGLSPKAKGKGGHKFSSKSKSEIRPIEFTDIQKKKVTLLAEGLFARRDELKQTLGETPYKGIPVTLKERKQQYQELKSSNELLVNLIADNSHPGKDGRLRMSKQLLETLIELSGE